MREYSVIVENVSKKFGISLKNGMKYGLYDSGRRFLGKGKDVNLRSGEFWALEDVNFSLRPGDSLGIMGVNGSGKTTLLRILNGTYSPDKGKVTLVGRVGALIAAGAGFSPMLTGRENIYISASLLGMSPSETTKKFDEIVEFAGLEEFIDMPVRNYSSGMTVRLGFSIAVLGTPDILLVDEVLAVGDLNFQKKCYERINKLKEEGTTIILVSHSQGAIWTICNKALILHNGKSTGIISVEDGCRIYDENNFHSRISKENTNRVINKDYGGYEGGTGNIFIESISLLNEYGAISNEIEFKKPFTLVCNIKVLKDTPETIIRIVIDSEIHKGICVIDSYEQKGEVFDLKRGTYSYKFHIKYQNFRPGVYELSCATVPRTAGIHSYYKFGISSFIIKHPSDQFLYADFRSCVHIDGNIELTSGCLDLTFR